MGSPSRNVQYHPPRLSEDRLNLPQPHSPSLPTHCSGKSGMRPWVLQRQFVHPPHQGHVLRALFPRRVVHRRAVEAQQRALAPDAQRAVPLDQFQACGAAQRCKPRRKKSRSTVNSQIFACRSRTVASCSESRDALPPAKTSSNPSIAWRFQAPTWFGWISCLAAIACTGTVAPQRLERHPLLEGRRVLPSPFRCHSSASRRFWNTP